MKYIKQVQSYLSRKNIKATRSEIREIYNNTVNDFDNPTTEELEAVKQHFIKQSEALTVDSGVPTQLSSLTEDNTPESTQQTALTYPVDDNKRQMVGFKASQMGIQLAASQVDVIASKIDTSNSSFMQTISDIETALIAYVEYQESQESTAVDTMLNRVTNRVIEKNQAISNRLNTKISDFTSAVETANSQLKSETSAIITRLRVPN